MDYSLQRCHPITAYYFTTYQRFWQGGFSGFPDFAERRSRDLESSDRIDLGEEEQGLAVVEPEAWSRCASLYELAPDL